MKMELFKETSCAILLCACMVTCLDLSALLPGSSGQELSNLKSMMHPDLLSRMKAMLPKGPLSASNANLSEIEKLIGKLKPAEGRLDPAMMEFLSTIDKSNSNSRPRSRSRNKGKRQEMTSTTMAPTTLTTASVEIPEEAHEERPKFSSRFRLAQTTLEPEESSTASVIDHISDPNIRNHRLYDDGSRSESSHESESPSHGQQRFENYENFTTIDQLEDLMADESYSSPQIVVAVPATPTTTPRVSRHTVSPVYEPNTRRGSAANQRRQGTISPALRRPSPIPSTTVTSFEDFISLESLERHPHSEDEDEEDLGPFHDREPLNQASTERAVVYPNDVSSNYGTSTEGTATVKSSSGGFKPSPLDLSPPVYFVPGQDFYTTTLKNHGNKNSGGKIKIVAHQNQPITRRRHSSLPEGPSYLSSSSPRIPPLNQLFDNYQQNRGGNLGDFYKGQQELIPTKNAFIHPSLSFSKANAGQMTEASSPVLSLSSPPVPPIMMTPKQDRILNPGFGTTYTYSSQNYAPTPASSFNYQSPAASENVYHDVPISQMNPFASNNNNYLPLPTDLSQAAGQQNYYASNPQGNLQYQHGAGAHHYGVHPTSAYVDQQAHDSGHHHSHHHPHHGHGGGHESSWGSTLFILGGVVALSAVVAFFLPTFLANTAATGAGKDTGDDKISHDDTDLWTEIKALYNDIVHVARGDYSAFVNNGGSYKKDLPKIKYEEVDDTSESSKNSTTTAPSSQSEEAFNVQLSGHPVSASPENSEEDTTSSGADEDLTSLESDERAEENSVDGRQRQSRNKVIKKFYNQSLPYNSTSTMRSVSGSGGVNFAQAFNQTLHAWEVVPLINT